MNIGVLGTGIVGETIASALVANGHHVKMGSRAAKNEKAAAWVKKSKANASQGNFVETAAFGEILFLCVKGEHTLETIQSLSPEIILHKIIVDITNPLDFSKGMPPLIMEGLGNTNSLGEEIQKFLPGAFVVKVLNTLTAKLMVKPRLVNKGDHNLFICGNDADSKNKVKHLLVDTFGWKASNLVDLGGIERARCTEAILPLWVSLMQSLGTPMFNFKIVK